MSDSRTPLVVHPEIYAEMVKRYGVPPSNMVIPSEAVNPGDSKMIALFTEAIASRPIPGHF